MVINNKTLTFKDTVAATHWLLSLVNEKQWLKHFTFHLNGKTKGFTSVYGGMGSFNDLVICRANNHKIAEDMEPLANELLRCLSSIAYAASIESELTFQQVIEACRSIGSELSGWRCRDCGYGQVSPRSIFWFSAFSDVRKAIIDSIESGDLIGSIQKLWDGFNGADIISQYLPSIEQSGIVISYNEGWLRPCPKCKSENTSVYRWILKGNKFVPADDNLAINRR